MDYEYILRNLIFFLITYLIVFIFCYFIAGRIKSSSKDSSGKATKKVSYKMMSEGKFIILRYNLDEQKINLKLFNIGICSCNAFIISTTSTVISMIPLKMFYQMLIGFVLVFALIYAVFEIYGRFLNKKWGKDKHE